MRIFRRPNLYKSLVNRTRGQWKRQLKRSFIPWYGKRGIGILHPRKYLYNKLYYRTSIGVSPSQLEHKYAYKNRYTHQNKYDDNYQYRICPKCGKKIPFYYNFCSSCGYKFN